MARRAIPMIAFLRVRCMFIYMFVATCVIVHIVEEVTSFRGLSQLMGVVHKRTCTQAQQTSRKKAV